MAKKKQSVKLTPFEVRTHVSCDDCYQYIIDRFHLVNNGVGAKKSICNSCVKKSDWKHECTWHNDGKWNSEGFR